MNDKESERRRKEHHHAFRVTRPNRLWRNLREDEQGNRRNDRRRDEALLRVFKQRQRNARRDGCRRRVHEVVADQQR